MLLLRFVPTQSIRDKCGHTCAIPNCATFKEDKAGSEARGGVSADSVGYVIYAIRDPTQFDQRRHHEHGPPIYVGQTKQLAVRANAHMRDGGQSYKSSRCKAGILKGIMKQWRVPRFNSRYRSDTSNFSHCSRRYGLVASCGSGMSWRTNRPEHRTAAPPRGSLSIPEKRFWNRRLPMPSKIEVPLRLEVSTFAACAKRSIFRIFGLKRLYGT